MADRAILGLFEDPDTAATATGELKKAGFSGHDFEILSSAPYPEGTFGEEEEHHRLYIFPLIGACSGFITGLLITAATQISYPLVTGGKPILSIPPMLIIMYEGTMLGALIFTVLGVLFESRLPNVGPKIYDPRITDGYVGVVVRGDEDHVNNAADVLQNHGAADVRRDDQEVEEREPATP